MTYEKFLALPLSDRMKLSQRIMRLSSNLENKTKMPTLKEMQIMNYIIRWQMKDKIKSWDKRVFKKSL